MYRWYFKRKGLFKGSTMALHCQSLWRVAWLLWEALLLFRALTWSCPCRPILATALTHSSPREGQAQSCLVLREYKVCFCLGPDGGFLGLHEMRFSTSLVFKCLVFKLLLKVSILKWWSLGCECQSLVKSCLHIVGGVGQVSQCDKTSERGMEKNVACMLRNCPPHLSEVTVTTVRGRNSRSKELTEYLEVSRKGAIAYANVVRNQQWVSHHVGRLRRKNRQGWAFILQNGASRPSSFLLAFPLPHRLLRRTLGKCWSLDVSPLFHFTAPLN